MNAEVFLDTNVLVYAAMANGRDAAKRERALALIDSENFGTSAQVLAEFYVTVVKKSARPLQDGEALEWIEQFAEFPCQAVDHRLVRIGAAISRRYRISYWDAAVIAAAQALGCHTLFSEDLNEGQRYEGIRVMNPFRK